MAEIENRDEFDAWLVGKPIGFVQALALRCSLRSVPFYTSQNIESVLSLWLVNFLLWFTYGKRQTAPFLLHSKLYIPNDGDTPSSVDAADCTYFAFKAFENTDNLAAEFASKASVISTSRDSAETLKAEYIALSSDASYFEASENTRIEDRISALITRPLWPDRPPPTLVKAWQDRKTQFMQWGSDWDVWIDWYEQRLIGSPIAFARLPIPYDDITTSIAMESEDFWGRTPPEVNAEINASLHMTTLLADEATEPLPGYFRIEVENDRLTAKPVAPETAQQEFARDMLEALRELVDDTRLALNQVQDDPLLTGLLDRLGKALIPDINDLRIGRLAALRVSLAAQAAAHDDPSRESHSTIRGSLNGLTDTLESLLAQFEAVREAKASQVALQITTTNLPALENALDQFTEIVAQSDAVDPSVLTALTIGQQERAELDVLASPIGASPQRLQAIASQMAELNGQRLVAAWNITERLKRFSEKELVATGKMLIDDLKWPALISLLVTLHAPLILICTLVPSFIVFKRVIENLQGAKDKSKDHKSPPAA